MYVARDLRKTGRFSVSGSYLKPLAPEVGSDAVQEGLVRGASAGAVVMVALAIVEGEVRPERYLRQVIFPWGLTPAPDIRFIEWGWLV
jgi:cyanophycinase-like exopeptidase